MAWLSKPQESTKAPESVTQSPGENREGAVRAGLVLIGKLD